MNENVYEQVKTQFGKTAQAYVTSAIHAKGDDLQVMLELAGNVQNKRVLDIATGGGHTALAFAKAGAEVTATDLTPEMLKAAREHAQKQGVTDVTFREANAENLPFAPRAFDLVTCRIAAHHFANPQKFVQEATRVLAPNGLLILVDNIAPQHAELASAMNFIEKTRDPSHVQAYSVKTWVAWLSDAGLEPWHLSRFRRTKKFRDWTSYAQMPEEAGRELEAYILSLPESYKQYFETVERAGRLETLSHEVVLLMAKKTAAPQPASTGTT